MAVYYWADYFKDNFVPEGANYAAVSGKLL